MSKDREQSTNKYRCLVSKRYEIHDSKERNLYVTICDDPVVGTPLEMWITLPDENKLTEQILKTDITTIAALFSEARQGGVPYTKLFKAMKQVCYSKVSIPYQLLQLLDIHCPMKNAKALEFEASEKQDVSL
jgi:hypothetical protein